MNIIELPVQTVLELACSAQRTNGSYIKEGDVWIQQLDPKKTPNGLPNKWLIQSTLRLIDWPDRIPPKDLVVLDEDRKLADNIKEFYKRLAFTVIAEDHTFDATIFSLFNSEKMKSNEIGFLAYIPAKYFREYSSNRLKRSSRHCDEGYLSAIGDIVDDLDCEIIEIYKSKNYDAYNIIAMIENKMCSWMCNKPPTEGPAVLVRAKIKEHSLHHKYGNHVTRLHYVRIAQ